MHNTNTTSKMKEERGFSCCLVGESCLICPIQLVLSFLFKFIDDQANSLTHAHAHARTLNV